MFLHMNPFPAPLLGKKYATNKFLFIENTTIYYNRNKCIDLLVLTSIHINIRCVFLEN